jgi:hypothetical protein
MIEIIEFRKGPLALGEQRRLVLGGDGPFTVSTSCFVEEPPPPGFRPCAQCFTTRAAVMEAVLVEADARFWARRRGVIELTITDAVGEELKLELAVIPDSDNASRVAVAGA